MDTITLFLGSDHIIKTPDFDFQKGSLRMSGNRNDAERFAVEKTTVGFLNMYMLDLAGLSVSSENQQAISGFEDTDVLYTSDKNGDCIILQTERALRALDFMGASFSHHGN